MKELTQAQWYLVFSQTNKTIFENHENL
jgi:hypothetical protein